MLGTDTKSFHVGCAMQNGRAGIPAPPQALDANHGWVRVVSVDNNIDGFGAEWEIARNTFKPFPCGIILHPVIDCCTAKAGTQRRTLRALMCVFTWMRRS
ncbi:hypothetical protein K438DRAFT_1971058 [Mycena galopus ATCC 62051]|nr:hypothetical protein K438DRAFT_1971058 [Mycena galopus ATCC 62051]